MADTSTLPPELHDAPEWLKQVLTEAVAPPPPPEPPGVRQLKGTKAWSLLLDAALVEQFLPRDLAPGIRKSRDKFESQVAALASLSTTSAGRGWALAPQTRRDILSAALQSPDLRRALKRTEARFSDPVSRQIRNIVTLAPFDADAVPLAELEARRIAVGLLHGTEGLTLEAPDSLDRAIELRRIVERFRRMVGKDKGGRFYGRERDVEVLRAYVGEIGTANLSANLQRWLKHAVRTFTGRRVLSIHGGGGVGKTTLLAHFVLEHIQAAANHFPFVYLDFDRTTISARAPAELLAEMCVQVTAQFPNLASALVPIRREALEAAALIDRTAEKAESATLDKLCYAFRQAIDEELSPADRTLGGALPFVLVFDTFELVQSNPGGADELASFVQHFLSPDEEGAALGRWPRLRLVISGRRPVLEFLGTTDLWPVDALDRKGSIELLLALAEDQGRPLTPSLATRLVDAVARSTHGPERGVRPLRLLLVAKALKPDSDISADAMVEDLIAGLADESSDLQAHLIDGILVRRILGHVGDPRVRDLSDPGLVVRYIDPEIIREVIAPATPSPEGSPEGATGYPLAPGEEEEIFCAFRNQVTLIEDHGTYVRHLQDVRREMLPLIRAKRQGLFEELHRRAYQYFKARRHDSRAAGEAIYHGLWCQAPVDELEELWAITPAPDARLDPEEFAFHSEASAYVRARTGRPLRAPELEQLPAGARLGWLAGQMPTYLRSRRPEYSLEWLEAAPEANEGFADQPAIAAGAAQLFSRAGKLATAHRIARQQLLYHLGALGRPSGEPDRRTIELLGSVVRIEAHVQVAWEITYLLEALDRIEDAAARTDILLNLLARPKAELTHDQIMSRLEVDLRNSRSRVEHGPRRLALVLVPELCAGLLPAHLAAVDALPRDPATFAASLAIVRAVATPQEMERLDRAEHSLAERPEHAFDAVDEIFRTHRSAVVELAAGADPRDFPFAEMLRFSHFDWTETLAATLERGFRDFENEQLRAHVAAFAPTESQSAILSKRLTGRRTLASIVKCGRLLDLCRSFGPDASSLPETFSEICGALYKWHLRLGEQRTPMPS